MVKTILDWFGKSGMDKGDAQTGSVVGGISLGVIFMLFVSQHQYEKDQQADARDRGLLWHEVHIQQEILIAHGLMWPGEDMIETNQQPKETK